MEITGISNEITAPPISKGVRFVPIELELGLYPLLYLRIFPLFDLNTFLNSNSSENNDHTELLLIRYDKPFKLRKNIPATAFLS